MVLRPVCLTLAATFFKDFVTTGHISSDANAFSWASSSSRGRRGHRQVRAGITGSWRHFSVATIVVYTALLSFRL